MSDYATPFHVTPDPDLIDLVPTYLQRRHDDAAKIGIALESGDLETIRFVGHSMKGSGAGYGFDGLTEIGAALESSGQDGDREAAEAAYRDLVAYLTYVEVDYD